MLGPTVSPERELLEDAAEDDLAHLQFYRELCCRLHSPNPLKRHLHRRSDGGPASSVLRYPQFADADGRDAAGQADDEWWVADRRYFSLGSMTK